MTAWRVRRPRPAAVLFFALAALIAYPAWAAYTGRNSQGVEPTGRVLAYRGPASDGPGTAYRTDISAVDTAGDVTATPGLLDIPAISCGRYTQVSCAVASEITTGSYTLRCVRYKPNASGTLQGVSLTDAAVSVPSAVLMTEGSKYLTNSATFDTDGAPYVRIFVVVLNHPSAVDLTFADLFADVQ